MIFVWISLLFILLFWGFLYFWVYRSRLKGNPINSRKVKTSLAQTTIDQLQPSEQLQSLTVSHHFESDVGNGVDAPTISKCNYFSSPFSLYYSVTPPSCFLPLFTLFSIITSVTEFLLTQQQCTMATCVQMNKQYLTRSNFSNTQAMLQ